MMLCQTSHNIIQHDYFLLKQNKGDKDGAKHVKDGSKSIKKEGESVRVNTFKTRKVVERNFLQIVPVKFMKNDGETINPFALSDNGSKSTFIREDFAK